MPATIFISIVTSALGLAYIVYGRRQSRFVAVFAGIALCAYSYFIVSWVWLCIAGALLVAAPFIIDW